MPAQVAAAAQPSVASQSANNLAAGQRYGGAMSQQATLAPALGTAGTSAGWSFASQTGTPISVPVQQVAPGHLNGGVQAISLPQPTAAGYQASPSGLLLPSTASAVGNRGRYGRIAPATLPAASPNGLRQTPQ